MKRYLMTRELQMYSQPRAALHKGHGLSNDNKIEGIYVGRICMNKLMIPCLYLQYEKAVTGFGQRNLFGDGDVEALAKFYSDNGADELLVFDFSSEDK